MNVWTSIYIDIVHQSELRCNSLTLRDNFVINIDFLNIITIYQRTDFYANSSTSNLSNRAYVTF